MADELRPFDDDAAKVDVAAMLDEIGDDWILTSGGDYATAACEVWQADGSHHQELIVLTWPGRFNHTSEAITVKLAVAPEDALGLAAVLEHSARWMIERRALFGGSSDE